VKQTLELQFHGDGSIGIPDMSVTDYYQTIVFCYASHPP